LGGWPQTLERLPSRSLARKARGLTRLTRLFSLAPDPRNYHFLPNQFALVAVWFFSTKVDEIVAGAQRRQLGLKQVPDEEDDQV